MITIIFLWLVSPIVLGIWLIVLHVKYDGIKKERDVLHKRLLETGNPTEILQSKQAMPPVKIDQSIPRMYQTKTEPEKLVRTTPTIPLVHTDKKSKNEGGNAVNATLITGVILVVVAGIIFGTTTWRIMPALVKVLLISSLSILFFAMAYFSEIKFKLRMTGIAFYHLGCLFVPVSILSIGYFRLFGSWFSMSGGGKYWLQLVMVLAFGVLTYVGYLHYKMTTFYYGSWIASGCTVWILARTFGNDWSRSVLWVSLYGTGIATWAILKKRQLWIIKIHPLLTLLCLLQALIIYSGDYGTRVTTGSVFVLAFFWIYKFSDKFLSRSLDSAVSRWLFPIMSIVGVTYQMGKSHYITTALIGLGTLFCLGSLFFFYESKRKRLVVGWGMAVVSTMLFLAVVGAFDVATQIPIDYIYLFFYTLMLFGIGWGKQWGKGRWNSSLLKHPAVSVAMITGLYGVLLFGQGGGSICILWELMVLWLFLRKNLIYALFAAVLGLLMPGLTLDVMGISLQGITCWFLIALVAACYYCSSFFYKNNLLFIIGGLGLYLGIVPAGILFFTSVPFVWEGVLLFGLILIVDILLLKKQGNLIHGILNLYLIPVVWRTFFYNVMWDENTIMFIIMAMGILMMIGGRLRFPYLYQKNKGKFCQIDYLSLWAVTPVLYAFNRMEPWWQFIGLIYVGIWFACGIGRQNKKTDKILTSGLALAFYLSVVPLMGRELSNECGWMLIFLQGLLYYLMAHKWGRYLDSAIMKYSGVAGCYVGILFSSLLYCFRNQINPWMGIVLLALILIADILAWKKNESWMFGVANIAVIPLVSRFVSICYPEKTYFLTIALVTGCLMMIVGRILFSKMCIIYYEEGQRRYNVDYCSLAASIAFFELVWDGSRIWVFLAVVYGAVWWINCYKRQNKIMDNLSLITALFMLFIAWVIQPFFQISSHFTVEYVFIACLLIGIASNIIWKDKKSQVELYKISMVALFAIIQGLDCIIKEKLLDVLILGIVMVGVLLMAYKKKNLSWLTLSLSTLVVLVVYITRSFWFSIAWWIYLLVAGLLLIGIAALHEYKKRDGISRDAKQKVVKDVWKWGFR